MGRDDRLASALGQPIAKLAGIVGTVGDQLLRRGDAFEQGGGTNQVVHLAGCHGESDRPADIVGQGVNLGRPSAARSSDGVLELPPFAPAAERCALT